MCGSRPLAQLHVLMSLHGLYPDMMPCSRSHKFPRMRMNLLVVAGGCDKGVCGKTE